VLATKVHGLHSFADPLIPFATKGCAWRERERDREREGEREREREQEREITIET
jgi:hypothetical protein